MRGMPNDAEKNPDADKLAELRDMEAKVRRMRDNRNSFRDQGKAMAKKRNAVQDQYKEHREKLDGMKAELDAIHTDETSTEPSVMLSTLNFVICSLRSRVVVASMAKRNPPPQNTLNF